MPKSDKIKISDEDIQAYLLGEGSADVYDKIQNVDDAAVPSLDADDLKIKKTLEAFRKVDQLFNEAIDQSIGIPPHLMKQVDEALNGSQRISKKNIFERLTNLVQDQFNFGSVFAGGVVGAFATVAFLNTAPLLTVGMDQNPVDPVTRSATAVAEEDNDQAQQIVGDIDWQITEKAAYKFVIFDTAGNQRTDETVAIGETFDLAIIPLESGPISIKYLSSDGKESLLVDNERFVAGNEFRLSVDKFNGKRPRFGKPIGTDSLLFISRNKIFETIKINVK